MKIEPRGKYAGVKVHLDGEEAQNFLTVYEKWYHLLSPPPISKKFGALNFALQLGKKIKNLMKEHPQLLEDRTEDEIAEALQRDKEKIEAQQFAMKKGKDWKGV